MQGQRELAASVRDCFSHLVADQRHHDPDQLMSRQSPHEQPQDLHLSSNLAQKLRQLVHKNPANPSCHCHEHRSTHLHTKAVGWLVHRCSSLHRRLRARPPRGRLLRPSSATRRLLRPCPAMRRRTGALPAMRRRPATRHRLVPGNQGVRPAMIHRLGRCPANRGGRSNLPPSLLPRPPRPWIHLQRRRIYRSPEPPRHLASHAAVHPWRKGATELLCVWLSVDKLIRLGGKTMADAVIHVNFRGKEIPCQLGLTQEPVEARFFGSDGRHCHVRAENAGILRGSCSFSSVWHSELKNSSRSWLRIPTKEP